MQSVVSRFNVNVTWKKNIHGEIRRATSAITAYNARFRVLQTQFPELGSNS